MVILETPYSEWRIKVTPMKMGPEESLPFRGHANENGT